ncbi:S8 family serine peptidase [Draconibacterium sp. IB214405]|nr:S8 family serine peptidase [Draconibacterium sp. IB214405]
MKKRFVSLLFTLIILCNPVLNYAQNFVNSLAIDPANPEPIIKEVIVKFNDNVEVNRLKSNGVPNIGLKDFDILAEKWSFMSMKKVFKNSETLKSTKLITFPDGSQTALSSLDNIFKIEITSTASVDEVVKELNKLGEVDYAEPNGVAAISNFASDSFRGTYPNTEDRNKKNLISSSNSLNLLNTDDPFFEDQWYLKAVKADSLWAHNKGDSVQVIGIFDTGVDWLHPDLKNKIWKNKSEIPDNGIDDDGNGFVDDVRGWDFVNDDNNPMDDNSHGTHCAGIAGAESNNGIGISGASWGAKIMPIKVFQSNGIGYYSQIAEGIWYASQNGCTIYSNSWSSLGESTTIRLALEYAYSTGVIVAAAGNKSTKTDLPFPPWPPYEPNYPACYNWVLGVQATDQSGNDAWFTNFDPTGPVVSDGRPYGMIYYNDFDYNYEMRVPGVSFISTVPGGQYRSYSGTSMATPLLAGGIAVMKSIYPELKNEQLFSKLIQPIKENMFKACVLDLMKCTFSDPEPDLYYVGYNVVDSVQNGSDGDARIDAGETVDLSIRIKNAGGLGDNVYAKLRFAEFEDTTVAQILKDTCSFGSVSEYASKSSSDGIRISFNNNIADGRMVSFQLMICQKGLSDTVYQDLALKVEHGLEINGVYQNLHLTPENYYIVTGPTVIDSLVIDPGVTLNFTSMMYLVVISRLQAVGEPDSMISFKASDDGMKWKGISVESSCDHEFSYCIFEDGLTDYTEFLLPNVKKVTHSIFRYNNACIIQTKEEGDYSYNLFYENTTSSYGGFATIRYLGLSDFHYNILMNNTVNYNGIKGSPFTLLSTYNYPNWLPKITQNIFMNNNYMQDTYDIDIQGEMNIYALDTNYFGTTDSSMIKSHILDFFQDASRAVLIPDHILTSPSEQCHGVVWKVELNDQNPQDGPIVLGSGPAKFSVYFNRAMDTTYVPFLTFGVRSPFTQNIVADSANWSADHKVWTAYVNIDKTSGDGENTIRVASARDLDHFEIPIERNRFKFTIQAASSQSVDFMATPGIGRIDLTWPLSDKTETLGYNVYRYLSLGADLDTVKLNADLLTDSVFTDFSVEPDSVYYYMFTILNTDFSEGDYSKVVSASPLSSANGDANGDLSVNVSDIVSVVNYILENDPEPFLFDAADVNYDEAINVLDIVALVNLIMKPEGSTKAGVFGLAQISIEDGIVYVDSPVELGGIQFTLADVKMEQEVEILEALDGFEVVRKFEDGKLTILAYSLSGNTISEGKTALLKLNETNNWIFEAILSNTSGQSIDWELKGDVTAIETLKLNSGFDLGQNYPNPFTGLTTIPFKLEMGVDKVDLSIYDILGRKLKSWQLNNLPKGEHAVEWDGANYNGICIYRMYVEGDGMQSYTKSKRMIIH